MTEDDKAAAIRFALECGAPADVQNYNWQKLEAGGEVLDGGVISAGMDAYTTPTHPKAISQGTLSVGWDERVRVGVWRVVPKEG